MPHPRPQEATLIEFGRLPVQWDPRVKAARLSGEAVILWHDLDAIWRATASSSIELTWAQIQASQQASVSAARRWVAALERAGLIDVARHGDGSVTLARAEPGRPGELRVVEAPDATPEATPEAVKSPAAGGRPEATPEPASETPGGERERKPHARDNVTQESETAKTTKRVKGTRDNGTMPAGERPIGELALEVIGWIDRPLAERRRIARDAADRIRRVVGNPQWWFALRVEDYIIAGELHPGFCRKIVDELEAKIQAKAEAQAAGLSVRPVSDRQKYLAWLIKKRAHWIDWSQRPRIE